MGSTGHTVASSMPWLVLEQLDKNLFRAGNEASALARDHVFGGQVAAQALRAAAHTVGSDRTPHSLHGYFLRRAAATAPIVFRVERDRDGRSFSARRVAAVQDGEVLFDMTASFHVPEPGPSLHAPMRPAVRAPDSEPVHRMDEEHPPVQMRLVSPPRAEGDTRHASRNLLWARVHGDLPDDPILHACLLTFFTDMGSGFGDVEDRRVPPFGPSIDHAIWFHEPARVDDWILLDSSPMKLGGGRGLYTGSAYDQAGRLVCMYTQEMLLRSS